MWWLYQAAMGAALALAGPWLLAGPRGRHYRATLAGRLGAGEPSQASRPVWLHAVSVGEVAVAATLARALAAELPLLVTTITPTGQERARAAFAGRAAVAYLPFDLGVPVHRFFRRHDPAALVLVEGDLWPLLMRQARRRNLPILVVNGRISDRNLRRLRRLRRWVAPLLDPVDAWGMQTAEDADRLREFGVPDERIAVTGNLKFEIPAASSLSTEADALVRRAAGGRPWIVAGSTMPGEEEMVLEAFRAAGGGTRALLVLAPRHPERWDSVDKTIRESGLEMLRRSRSQGPEPGRPDVLLLDSLGELAGLYHGARGCFIGGTLVATGGHNPLEAARWSVPVAAGASMENFREIAQAFDEAAGWHRVNSVSSLATVFGDWCDNEEEALRIGEIGHRVLLERRGALEKTLRFLDPWLAPLDPSIGKEMPR